jgi:hypothetical protein
MIVTSLRSWELLWGKPTYWLDAVCTEKYPELEAACYGNQFH